MKKSPSELYKWLKSQESVGTLESSGEFTLEQSKAWKKLGAFQLPFEEGWVLKVVQAAMAHKEAQLEITQTREESVFQISNAPHWQRALVEKAVFSVDQEPQRDVAHLAVGLRALVQLEDRPFSVQYPSGKHLAWTGEKFVELPTEKDAVGKFQLSVANFTFDQSRSIFSVDNMEALALRAEITKTLSNHCHLARQSIKVDSREIATFLQDPKFGVTDSSRPLALLKCAQAPELPGFQIAEPEEFEAEAIGIHTVAVPKVKSEIKGECSVAGLLSAFVEQRSLRTGVSYYDSRNDKSEILWLQDGVVVLREPFLSPNALGIAAIISAEGLPTDLSGLIPRKGKLKNARKSASLKMLYEELLHFQKELGPEGFDIEHEQWKTYLTGLAGGLLLFVVPIFGLAVLSKAGYDYSSKERRAGYLDKALDQGLVRLIESFERRVV